VRRTDFSFTPDIPEQWGAENNPFITALMAALSAQFPAGERYFIDSVRHYLARIHAPS
jgi:predicted metal-dependent hydrolase